MYTNMAVLSKQIIMGHDHAIAAWVGNKLGIADFGPCSAIGVTKNGKLIAGAVYGNYHEDIHGRPLSIEVTIVSIDKTWLSRHILSALFGYPFTRLKVRRVQLTTSKRNKKLRTMFERLGFKFEGVLRKAWREGGDAVVYSMLPHECSWIKKG